MELETKPCLPVLEPVSKATQLRETTDLRAEQPTHQRASVSITITNANSVHSTFTTLLAETVPQVGEFVEHPEDEKEEMMLVTTVAPKPHSEGCLLAGARREICPSSPEWSTPTGRELIAQGVKIETDMLICDKRTLVPVSLEESALVPKERIVPSRMVFVGKM